MQLIFRFYLLCLVLLFLFFIIVVVVFSPHRCLNTIITATAPAWEDLGKKQGIETWQTKNDEVNVVELWTLHNVQNMTQTNWNIWAS